MAPRIHVIPRRALLDEALAVSVEGLRPGSDVAIGAETVDSTDVPWQSALLYRADPCGTVRTERSAVVGTGDPNVAVGAVAPLALLWAIAPLRRVSGPFRVPDVLRVRITARQGGQLLCASDVERITAPPSVRCVPVNVGNVVGTLWIPPGEAPAPTVVVLGGSGGRAPRATAALLAARGCMAFAQSYFGTPPLAPVLEEVPVEVVAAATRLLSRHPRSSVPVGVLGISKGAELALLAAAMTPEIGAVIAYSPSAVVFAGFGGNSRNLRSSWTQGGRPVPFARWRTPISQWLAASATDAPIPLAHLYGEALADGAQVQLGAIPVERARGPLLLIAGKDDQMWPSERSVELIEGRLASCANNVKVRSLLYPQAGHGIGLPGRPTTIRSIYQHGLRAPLPFGGTPAGDAAASVNAWAHVLAFLGSSPPTTACYSTGCDGGSAPLPPN